jgi:hypothetical protein
VLEPASVTTDFGAPMAALDKTLAVVTLVTVCTLAGGGVNILAGGAQVAVAALFVLAAVKFLGKTLAAVTPRDELQVLTRGTGRGRTVLAVQLAAVPCEVFITAVNTLGKLLMRGTVAGRGAFVSVP